MKEKKIKKKEKERGGGGWTEDSHKRRRMNGKRGKRDMVGQSDKYALDIEERMTELKFCGIPVEWALINCGMGSKQGLGLLGPGLGK